MTGLCMVLLLSGAQKIDQNLYEAAQLDGAGPVQEFFAVTLPALRGEIAVALSITTVAALASFDIVYVTTGGAPADRTTVPGLLVYRLAFNQSQVGLAAAIADRAGADDPRRRTAHHPDREGRLKTCAKSLPAYVALVAIAIGTLLPLVSIILASFQPVRVGSQRPGLARRRHFRQLRRRLVRRRLLEPAAEQPLRGGVRGAGDTRGGDVGELCAGHDAAAVEQRAVRLLRLGPDHPCGADRDPALLRPPLDRAHQHLVGSGPGRDRAVHAVRHLLDAHPLPRRCRWS